MPARVYQRASDVLFYAPGSVVKSWRETPQGERACRKAFAGPDYRDATRQAPIGTVYEAYTIVRYAMASVEIRPDADGGTRLLTYGAPLAADPGAHQSLLDVEFRIGIRQWSAIDRTED